MTKFSLLTPEEENLIPQYQKKWRDIQLSTEPIDRQKAEDAVKAACTAMRSKVPEIVFCDSPYAALKLKKKSSKPSQRKNSTPKSNNPESSIFSSSVFQIVWTIFWFVFGAISSIIMLVFLLTRQRFTQAKDPISRLQEFLTRSSTKQWKKKFKSLMPKTPSAQDVQSLFEQTFQDISNVHPNFQAQLDEQNRVQVQDSDFASEQASENSTDSFPNATAIPEEQFTNFFTQAKIFRWFFIGWFKNTYINTNAIKISGTNHPQVDAQIQMWLLAESSEVFQKNAAVFMPQSAAIASILLDFSTSVVQFSINEKKWQAFQSLVQECGWIFSFDRQIVICDRPRKLSFDSENRLHAEGKPAIEFADGFSIYAHHGVILPEKYGQLHPEQWQAQWLLEEKNAELRRVLIQGVGYARLCQDLAAIELDSWQEYTLLKIENEVDVEPIHLLKMTCPSTAYIHAARVPPTVQSAREAIRWVNWDTDPEEFSQQT